MHVRTFVYTVVVLLIKRENCKSCGYHKSCKYENDDDHLGFKSRHDFNLS